MSEKFQNIIIDNLTENEKKKIDTIDIKILKEKEKLKAIKDNIKKMEINKKLILADVTSRIINQVVSVKNNENQKQNQAPKPLSK